MSKRNYRTAPDPTLTGMPPGVPFIIGNEAAERFSFYGMRSILVVFMTQHLLSASGALDLYNDEQAKIIFHLFVWLAYLTPLAGAIISDVFWGKYKTILVISLMYCIGHGCLALMDLGPVLGAWDMKPLMFAGLLLIAMGAGGIKPCVSANVGDQFGEGNKRLMTQVFNWFYFSINVGAVASQLATPWLLAKVGPWLAFGLPGVLMGVATLIFWMGRDAFVHVPPAGWTRFKAETFSRDGITALKNLSPLFLLFIPLFWAIFDQTGSAWVLQADRMNRGFLGLDWLPSQIQAVNPFLILVGIPVFTYVVYPLMGRLFNPTPLRKIGIGLAITALSFGISALIEMGIERGAEQAAQGIYAPADDLPESDAPAVLEARVELAALAAGNADVRLESVIKTAREAEMPEEIIQAQLAHMPNVGWQFLAYIILTAAEIMVSIVCLEFAYTQSPPKMKSFIMSVYFLSVALGNALVVVVNGVLEGMKDDQGRSPLDGSSYYWTFTIAMAAVAVVYVFWSTTYRGRTYIQGEDPAAIRAESEAEGAEVR